MSNESKENMNKINKDEALDLSLDTHPDKESKLEKLEQELFDLQDRLSKKEASLNQLERELKGKEIEAKNGFPELVRKEFVPKEKHLDKRFAELENEFDKLEKEKSSIQKQKLELYQAEIERKNGYADEREKVELELHELRSKELDDLEKTLSKERDKRLRDLDTKTETFRNELKEKRKQLENKELDLEEFKNRLDRRDKELDLREEYLDERYSKITEEVEQNVAQRKKSFELEKERYESEIARLQDSIQQSTKLVHSFQHLKRKLGDEDPAEVIAKLARYEEEIAKLREELATRPTFEQLEAVNFLEDKIRTLENERDRFRENFQKLHKSQSDNEELALNNQSKSREIEALKDQLKNLESHNGELQQQLDRYRSPFENSEDYSKRIEQIEKPLITEEVRFSTEEISEVDWLDRIYHSCNEYGIKFPRRILDAFHTALKTSEWSPLTVLAGVSGTGKSELPRLYSRFGGINFLNLSVQPNWDSQESMLGFFNSIDNKFDAQPVLQLLAQSQKDKTEEYPYGLKDAMSIILMDEMNLAHIELYFAEFLSKLELRRGMKRELPELDVKLGSNVPPYKLKIGRNVLWTGTMNQDETTKSLSDKVLDRGIVINFPRPVKLERRKRLRELPERAPLLSRMQWQSWWSKESTFTDEQIMPYKAFIEEMNSHLSKVGRALGHRVWQSVEYYMMNHPKVMQAMKDQGGTALDRAMKVAFEDQLVQKVMPKLRGIETRGTAKTECLDKIQAQLVNDDYAIVEDFQLAQKFGYGQFIWNSANYLTNSSLDEESSVDAEPNQMDDIVRYCKENGIKPREITIKEIMDKLSCDALIAQEIKNQCKKLTDE